MKLNWTINKTFSYLVKYQIYFGNSPPFPSQLPPLPFLTSPAPIFHKRKHKNTICFDFSKKLNLIENGEWKEETREKKSNRFDRRRRACRRRSQLSRHCTQDPFQESQKKRHTHSFDRFLYFFFNVSCSVSAIVCMAMNV